MCREEGISIILITKFFSVPPGFRAGNINHLLALGFGSGLVKHAPGTWGSAAALLLFILLLSSSSGILYAAIVLGFVAGVFICQTTADDFGVHDHSAIVWDEFVGQWISLAFIPLMATNFEQPWLNYCLAFIAFRFFDIAKPWPISSIDSNIHGGLGIMLDDVLAGLLAGLSLVALSLLFNTVLGV